MAWLSGWNRRKQLYLSSTNITTQSNYQMRIVVNYGSGTDSYNSSTNTDNIYCGSNCNTDFSDIRFTDSTGNNLLYYWIESTTPSSPPYSSAIIWVKIPSIPNGTNSANIYIYYNNSSPPSDGYNNIDNTFIFGDDFSVSGSYPTSKWDKICKINDQLSNSGGYLILGSPPGSLANGGGCPDGSSPASGSVIKNKVDIGNGVAYHFKVGSVSQPDVWQRYGIEWSSTGQMSDKQGVCTCNNNVGNSVGADKYRLMIYPGYGQINLQRYDSGSAIFDNYITGYSIANKYIKIQYLAPNLNVYSSTDGSIWGSPLTISTSNAPSKTGRLLFTSYNCCDRTGTIYFDYIFTRNFASPEPTWSSTISSEQNVALTISSNPTGAEIWIAPHNGSYVDQGLSTNNTLGIVAGTYDIKLTKGTYQDWYLLNQTFSAGQSYLVQATLSPIPGSLAISSIPTGAEIYLALSPATPTDQGVTTQSGGTTISNLTPGTYNIKLTLSGYLDWTGTATVTSNTTNTVSPTPTFAGSANITSTPAGAEIYLAISPGTPTDQSITTPRTIIGLTAASSGATTLWNYKLAKSGYADTSGSFTATAGQTTPVPVTFPGSLYITSIPTGTQIYIDGVLQ